MGIDYFNCTKCDVTIADCSDGYHSCGACGSVYCRWCLKDEKLLVEDEDYVGDEDREEYCDEDRYVECAACSSDASVRSIVTDKDIIKWLISVHDYGNRDELVKQFIETNCVQPPEPEPEPEPETKRVKTE